MSMSMYTHVCCLQVRRPPITANIVINLCIYSIIGFKCSKMGYDDDSDDGGNKYNNNIGTHTNANTNDNDDEATFSCKIESVKMLTAILNCLGQDTKKHHPCYVEITNDAISFTVNGKTQSSQIKGNLDSTLFEEYNCTSTCILLAINLSILLDCLNIFGSQSEAIAATLDYSTNDQIFKISLEEHGALTTCEINSLYTDVLNEEIVSMFRHGSETCQIIIRSDGLYEAMESLLELVGASYIVIEVNKQTESLKVACTGSSGKSYVFILQLTCAYTNCIYKCVNCIIRV